MDLKRYERKLSPYLRFYLGIFLEGLRKIMVVVPPEN
jgi:hypothetical protein